MKDDKERICKVSEAVQQLALSKPFILESISTKTINYTKMADYLLPEIEELVDEKPSLPAVNMALRRFAQKYMEGEFKQEEQPKCTQKLKGHTDRSYQINISTGYCGISDTPSILTNILQYADNPTEIYTGIGVDGKTYLFLNSESVKPIKQKLPQSALIEDSCIKISISADSNSISTTEDFNMKIYRNKFPFSLIQLRGSESTIFCRTIDLAAIL